MTNQLYKNGLEKYPITVVIGQNLFLALYFGLGAAGMWNTKIAGAPAVSLIYIIFLVVMLGFVLRKHLCTNCYYYNKMCSTGWGKLAAIFFKKNSGNYELGIKLAQITWGTATIFPIIIMAISLIAKFKTRVLILLIAFLILSSANFMIHKYSCTRCKMRNICPASMAKAK